MSNRRRPSRGNTYRTGYLKSVAWFERRALWFRVEAEARGVVRCAVCAGIGTARGFELHHLDYVGVVEDSTGWIAGECHGDLVAVHPGHHSLIHELIDRDRVLRTHRGRRAANLQAIARLRNRIAKNVLRGLE